jgi:hypothetical protein
VIVDTLFFSNIFMVRVSTTFDLLKYTTPSKLVLYWIATFFNISGKFHSIPGQNINKEFLKKVTALYSANLSSGQTRMSVDKSWQARV